MKLVLISPPQHIPSEHEMLIALFEAGLECFHLRKPDFLEADMEHYLHKIPETYRKYIMLHTHHKLAKQYGLRGMHFSSSHSDASSSAPVNHNENTLKKSMSLHSLEELECISEQYEYVFLSPLFNSISKKGYHTRFDLAGVKKALKKCQEQKQCKTDIIALGGVDENKITFLKELGFDGIALLGAIWSSGKNMNTQSIVEKFKTIQEKCLPNVLTH